MQHKTTVSYCLPLDFSSNIYFTKNETTEGNPVLEIQCRCLYSQIYIWQTKLKRREAGRKKGRKKERSEGFKEGRKEIQRENFIYLYLKMVKVCK